MTSVLVPVYLHSSRTQVLTAVCLRLWTERENLLLPLTSSVGGPGPCSPAEFSAQTPSFSHFNGDSVRFCGSKTRILLEQSDSLETL